MAGADAIARVVLPAFYVDPELVHRQLELLDAEAADYCTLPRDFNLSFGADVCTTAALQRVHVDADGLAEPLRGLVRFRPCRYWRATGSGTAVCEDVPEVAPDRLGAIRRHPTWPERAGPGIQGGEYEALAGELLRPSDVVLDAGCGHGEIADVLRRHCERVVGVDYDARAIGLARERFPAVEFHAGDLERWSTGERFDVIVHLHTLEHLPDPVAALRNLRGLLGREVASSSRCRYSCGRGSSIPTTSASTRSRSCATTWAPQAWPSSPSAASPVAATDRPRPHVRPTWRSREPHDPRSLPSRRRHRARDRRRHRHRARHRPLLAARGARVVLAGRREDLLAKAVEEVGHGAAAFALDVTDRASLPAVVERIEQEIGPIAALVNNAGNHIKTAALEHSDADFDAVVDVHLGGGFALTREVGRRMVARGRGSVVFLSSMNAHIGMPEVPAYSAAKAGITGLVKTLCPWSGRGAGVRVNAVAPGFIDAGIAKRVLGADRARRERVLARIPMERLGTADEIGWATAYLCLYWPPRTSPASSCRSTEER